MTATQTPIHINDAFFAKAARYFNGIEGALTELLQNAYRASLPMITADHKPVIDIFYENNVLSVVDSGRGITDVGAMLSIADSRWGDGVEGEQDPAGMGVCGILAACTTLHIYSTFGHLCVDSHAFFTDGNYRAELLDQIESIPYGGTRIEMHGVKGCIVPSLIQRVARYHVAVTVRLNDELVPNILSECRPLQLDHDADAHYTYAGYPVYRYHTYRTIDGQGRIYIAWHGQLIEVDNNACARFTRLISLPGGDAVAAPITTGLPHAILIVIDHGAAPITPRLPSRDALVYDDKTVDFLWGLTLPLLEHSVAAYDAHVVEAAGQQLSDIQGHRLAQRNTQLPKALSNAIVRSRLDAIEVTIPALYDGSYARQFVPSSAPLYTPYDEIVLRFNDGARVLVTNGLAGPVEFAFADAVSGCEYPGSQLTDGDTGVVVPKGIIAGVKRSFGREPVVKTAIMVVTLPVDMPSCEGNVVLGCGPLNVDFYVFDELTGDYADDEDRIRSISRAECITDELDGAKVTFSAKISGFMVGDGAYCVDDHSWVGQRAALIGTTYDLERVYQDYDWDGCEERPSTRELAGWFDVLRTQLGDAASICNALQEFLEMTVGYHSVRHVQSITFDHAESELHVTVNDGVSEKTHSCNFRL